MNWFFIGIVVLEFVAFCAFCSVVDPHYVDADPDPHREKRIRIQVLVNDIYEFYFPIWVFPSLHFRYFKEVIIIYYKSNEKLLKQILCPLFFAALYALRNRSGYVFSVTDPDPAK